jgi:hypothetical protein
MQQIVLQNKRKQWTIFIFFKIHMPQMIKFKKRRGICVKPNKKKENITFHFLILEDNIILKLWKLYCKEMKFKTIKFF